VTQPADFYTLGRATVIYENGIGRDATPVYHVDLSSGRTTHVGDADAQISATVYDEGTSTLYAWGWRTNPNTAQLLDVCLFIVDPKTWHCEDWWAFGWVGSYAMIAASSNDVYASNGGNSFTHFSGNHADGAYTAGGPFYYVAFDPLGHGLFGFEFRDNTWLNSQLTLDTQPGGPAQTILSQTTSDTLSFGPVAFYPHSHHLYRYAYDGQGNAWLTTIDLPTGKATIASAPFSAPGHAIFFLPRNGL
jgi:hypothetical protein